MFSTKSRLCTNRGNVQIIDELIRFISKTSSVPNVDVMVQKDDLKDRKDKKLYKLRKYHRSLSTVTSRAIPQSAAIFAQPEKTRNFIAVFPDLVRDITEDVRRSDMSEVNKWLAKAMEYNVPLGKKNRAVELTMAYKLLEKPERLTEENLKLSYVLGWCTEMFHAAFMMTDDIVDATQTRRGAPCWYRQPDVGLSGINDAIMIENSLYLILKKYFENHPAYVNITELFHKMALKTAMGHCLDTHCHREGRPNLDIFTMDRYSSIARYKTSYYSFKMPVALAMYLAGIYRPELHRQSKHVLLEIGHFLQVQDDFLDCFGDPEVTGKDSTDIREGKCTWLAVVALQRVTPQQRKLFEQHYGNNDQNSIDIIKDIYEQLGLPNTYAIYEEKSFNLIKTHIQQMSHGLPHKLFFTILEMVYGRTQSTF